MIHAKLSAVALVFLLCGCSAEDVAKLSAARDETAAAVTAAKNAEGVIGAQIAALPATDPVRQALEPQITRLDAIISRGEQFLPVLDGAVKSAQSGQMDPTLAATASAIPYGSLALAVVGLVWGVVKHVQAGNALGQQQTFQQAFEQVVDALDSAVPEPTPAQQAAIAGALDANVKARVAAVRAT